MLLLSMLLCYCRVLHIPPLDYAPGPSDIYIYISVIIVYVIVLL